MNKTLFYFNNICKIARPSGHEENICKFLQNFAQERNLEYFIDDTKNIIIKKPSNCGKNQTLILQAHSDMVCEKLPSKQIDFLKDGISTITEGDFLMADGTTLGADNGVGLSMILSVLDDNNIKIPNLECVFTTQEETTMLGAINLNTSLLKGKHLLSIDGTDEGKIEVSSAGMTEFKAEQIFKNLQNFETPQTLENQQKSNEFQKNFSLQNETAFEICLTGFRGGHSGSEIASNKLNAIKIACEFLSTLKGKIKFINIEAGNKPNAIPRDFYCTLLAQNITKIQLETLANDFLQTYKKVEKDAQFAIKEITKISKPSATNCILSVEQTNELLDFVCFYKNGVLSKNKSDFVVTSNNLASINLVDGKVKIVCSLRSSDTQEDSFYENKIMDYFKKYNFEAQVVSRAPFFERNKNSYLQPLCLKTYKQLFNKEAVLEDIHAGLEGGVFAKKIPDIDICVIAPNIYNAHSPSEKVSLSSIERVYSWLEKIIEEF